MIYLQQVAAVTERQLRLGGHSKGGNLTVYAAGMAPAKVRERILEIYSNDGPGFSAEFQTCPEAAELRGKIRRLVPDSSIIGILFLPVAEPIRVKSSVPGLLQHDGLTWEVEGPASVRCEKSHPLADLVNDSLNAWIQGLEPETRSLVITDLFAMPEATGATTLSGLQKGGLKTFWEIQKNMKNLRPESQQAIQKLFQELRQHLSIKKKP